MATITFQIDTIKELDHAADIIRAIRALHPEAATSNTGNAAATGIAGWFNRLGTGSRIFWERAARHALSHPDWTFDDLAESPEDKKKLRSYHRNSYRAIKVEGAVDPLIGRWDAQRDCQVYHMRDAVRDEILHLLDLEKQEDQSQK